MITLFAVVGGYLAIGAIIAAVAYRRAADVGHQAGVAGALDRSADRVGAVLLMLLWPLAGIVWLAMRARR